MRALAGLSVLIGSLLAVSPAMASVDEAWLEVQEVLSASDGRSLVEPADDLIQAAQEIDLQRMPPYASAMVAWSIAHPEAGSAALETAVRLDPKLPAAYFLLSRRHWQDGARTESAKWYLKGWWACLRQEVVRRHLFMSGAIWLILGAAASSAAALLVLMVRTIRRSAFDAMALGGMIFERANAVIFGFVLLLLPLFAGLGPAWVLVYLFILGWVYLDDSQRAVAMAVCVVLALVPVLAEGWQRALLRVPTVADHVDVILDDRCLDPSALREFLELKEHFSGDPSYHLILGELLRIHSAVESAKLEFQVAAAETLGDARPFVFLGNMALEDGNVQLAIQHYDAAIDIDGRTALAYHNLSSAYDLNRRFEQGDAARARARELAGGRSASLGYRGRDPRVRYPEVSSDDVAEFVSGLSDEERLLMGSGSFDWRWLRRFLDPLSMVFWVGGVVGGVILVIRLKWFAAARECTKCGKIYRLDDEPGESSKYCRQCVSVFLQRDLVPIDQQTAKLAQVRRWDRWTGVARRLTSVAAPGSADLIGDRVLLGVTVGLVAWTALVGVLVWVPRFLEVIEPAMPVRPVVGVLAAVFVAAWAQSVASSWRGR
ncbi:MAG: hypothetical protein V2I67_06970 [Thermoanaerobaculales bacterium]|jgi:tetratricopeptide (TPR) repeat protein|nr:hypothetical protein [Thermoanaerobaculales bacterium]